MLKLSAYDLAAIETALRAMRGKNTIEAAALEALIKKIESAEPATSRRVKASSRMTTDAATP